MKATGRGLPTQVLGGSNLATMESNFTRVIGREIVAGLNTITTGTETMTGIRTGTATMTKIMTKTSTTTTVIARNPRHWQGPLPARPSVC